MINIYFAKSSRSIDMVKMTHIKVNDYTQETKTVANISQTVAKISQYENI